MQQSRTRYLADNINYPEQAINEGVEGRVVVCFVVETDGSLSNIKVERGVNEACDKEALRVVEQMPMWKTGYIDGKPVRSQYYLPIVFKLQ